MKFTEEQLEKAIIELLEEQGYPHVKGTSVQRSPESVLIKEDLYSFLSTKYGSAGITDSEITSIIRQITALPASDLYESNKIFCLWLADGFMLRREDSSEKDLHIQLTDDSEGADNRNIYKIVNQLEIEGKNGYRIPDGILYVNGLPLVVFEFKSAIRIDATIHDAWVQLTTRYRRDIPQLFVTNALCVISDGVNNKTGSLFSNYEYFYGWRKVTGNETMAQDGINSLHTLIQGLFDKVRLQRVCRDFVFFPDKSHREEKIICRYPQFYATNKLYANIKQHKKPAGDGKGGTCFGATGCGKSFTMQFLARRLMKSLAFESPTIVLITDRTDLDDQLARQFTNAKTYIGDNIVQTINSRLHLRSLLKGRSSGGVFLTTVHKFTEDIQLLSERDNIICISDEAHRTQVNLEQKVKVTEKGVQKRYGFAKYLRDSLPNATYVGFSGTPIDATLDVFGPVVDSYTMTESVADEITVPIVYEGRAAKVLLDNSKLKDIEAYYEACAEEGASEYQIEESKKANLNMGLILGDPDRIRAVAQDFVNHYEKRCAEGATVKSKALFVCASRDIAWRLYKEIQVLQPAWFEALECEKGQLLSERERKKIKPMERVKMVMTRHRDDEKALYNLLGDKADRKELDRQFKNEQSNFKIAIVVDMWLTGFDVPCLDTIYIDKPVKKHNLIQTISRVNRKYANKPKGLVVDYVGIKKQMNKALKQYSAADSTSIEDVEASVASVKDDLSLLKKLFHRFDTAPYFSSQPLAQLNCLNQAAEFILGVKKNEERFMALVKRLKAAFDVCCGSEKLDHNDKDLIHFYQAVRSIVFKLTRGSAPDTAQMNARVREMINEAIKSDGVEEILKMGEESSEIDIFDADYLAKVDKIKFPNIKIQLLKQLLAKAIGEFKKTNRIKGVDFSKRFESLVKKYNERKADDVLSSEVVEDFSDEIITMITELKDEMSSHKDLDIDFEETAFYDILKRLAIKYDFTYPEDKLLVLAREVKVVVDSQAKYPDWDNREDIKAALKVDLILLLGKHEYPPVDHDEVYKDIFEQAENFKKHRCRT